MKEIEQIKDRYGNLIQLWGIYQIKSKVDTSTAMVKKSTQKKLIGVYNSLKEAKVNLR